MPLKRVRRWRVVPLYGRYLGEGLTRESADAVGCPQNDPSA